LQHDTPRQLAKIVFQNAIMISWASAVTHFSLAAHAAVTPPYPPVLPGGRTCTTIVIATENWNDASSFRKDDNSGTTASETAARFLLEDGYSNSSFQKRRGSSSDVIKQANMQDQRLRQCEESGKDWEQCFFYGTKTVNNAPQEDKSMNEQGRFATNSFPADTGSISKSKIPTW